jgi:asparagine synthase (glutamine-hydrolysing)
MCGIAGIVSSAVVGDARERVRCMTEAQVHRGPDDGGVADLSPSDESLRVVFGSRRLAILDLSAAGHQPMCNEDGSVWVVFNGEIYNFAELRSELLELGHRFRSRSDTEVLLHGYESWGLEQLLKKLNGMFAFAIWDTRNRRVAIGRDRLGEKPLYYFWDQKTLIFASELKAVIASGLIKPELSPAATVAYLTLGSVPAPLSMIKGVNALPPGHMIILEAGKLRVEQYWRLNPAEEGIGAEEAVEEVSILLRDSVKLRLVSDVPVGVFLSGGLDSSSIVALARELTTGVLRTYSMVFREQEFSEGPWAEQVARKFGTEHVAGEITSVDVREQLPAIVSAMDQPSVDGVNTYYVSRFTRGNGTVVALSGVGGDEVFGGYATFRTVPRLMRLKPLFSTLTGLSSWAAWAAQRLPRGWSMDRLAEFIGSSQSIDAAYLAVRGMFSARAVAAVLDPDFAAEGYEEFNPLLYLSSCAAPAQSIQNRVGALELRTYMHNQLLRDTDVMSMAHSLEVRSPMLDHRLVEFVAKVPAAVKFNGRPKSLMIEALGDKLPAEVVTRPKRGFHFPFEVWLKDGLRGCANDILFDNGTHGVVNSAGVQNLWQRFLDGRVHWSRPWSLIVLMLWIRTLEFGSQV